MTWVPRTYDGMGWTLHNGDALGEMATLPDDSVEALICDPPAGISFMGADWDGAKGGRDEWIAWLKVVMAEALRVVKPGGHGLVWALPRTSHWTATALEDAGWEIRDRVSHLFGTGFPKSLDVSKALDKSAGAERQPAGRVPRPDGSAPRSGEGGRTETPFVASAVEGDALRTEPVTEEARQWGGWGTALKPAVEDWWLVRKPLDGTVVANVRAHGTGALNIDATRIAATGRPHIDSHGGDRPSLGVYGEGIHGSCADGLTDEGRWPAHIALSHSPDCVRTGTKRVRTNMATGGEAQDGHIFGYSGTDRGTEPRGYADPDGTEEIDAWECAPDCAVAELDRQSGEGRARGNINPTARTGGSWFGAEGDPGAINGGDAGGASRFFFTSKASRAERNAGLDDFADRPGPSEDYGTKAQHPMKPEGEANLVRPVKNHHTTVKPIDLMRWLVRLITPPEGTVLDCFAGSGTTGCAALLEGRKFVGIERQPDYAEIAVARLRWWENVPAGTDTEAALATANRERQASEAGQGSLLL